MTDHWCRDREALQCETGITALFSVLGAVEEPGNFPLFRVCRTIKSSSPNSKLAHSNGEEKLALNAARNIRAGKWSQYASADTREQ